MFRGKVSDGQVTDVVPTDLFPSGVVGEFTAGVYTCICVVGLHILDLGFHVDRLVDGIRRIESRDLSRERVQDDVLSVVSVMNSHKTWDSPTMLTVIVGETNDVLWWHAMKLPERVNSLKCVLVTDLRTRNDNREGPSACVKQCVWVKERGLLEQEKVKWNAAETVMVKKGGEEVLEGLITNVFVVLEDGTIQTACDSVLPGCMRRRVIKTCRELGIPLQLTSPRVKDALQGRWRELFLTSVAKPITRIERAIFEIQGKTSTVEFSGHPVVEQVRAVLLDNLDKTETHDIVISKTE